MDLLDELTICLENSQHNKGNVASFNVASAIPLAVNRGPYALASH
jgi:hypothetical protein